MIADVYSSWNTSSVLSVDSVILFSISVISSVFPRCLVSCVTMETQSCDFVNGARGKKRERLGLSDFFIFFFNISQGHATPWRNKNILLHHLLLLRHWSSVFTSLCRPLDTNWSSLKRNVEVKRREICESWAVIGPQSKNNHHDFTHCFCSRTNRN